MTIAKTYADPNAVLGSDGRVSVWIPPRPLTAAEKAWLRDTQDAISRMWNVRGSS